MLRTNAADTLHYLGNEFKPERERAVCRAFLRCVGIAFAENEIVAPSEEPADVSFREARFQIRELMEKGRRRGDEWKHKQDRWNCARSMHDIVEPTMLPVPMPFSEFVAVVSEALKEKSEKYGKKQCSGIDALVYVNLTATRFLDQDSPFGDLSNLNAQGWRSVGALFPPYGVVLFALETAPHFLLSLTGNPLNEWSRPDGLFDP